MGRSKKVEKALSTEETTALSNIQSILSEILQMNPEPSLEPMEGEDVMNADDEYENVDKAKEEDDDEDELEKSLETTESDSETASDDSEERLSEPLTELTEENLNTVSKTLLKLISKSQEKTQKKKDDSSLSKVLTQLVKIQKGSQEQINDLSEAFQNVLSGLGVFKQIEIAKDIQEKKKPDLSQDNIEILSLIQKALTPSKVEDNQEVQKANSNGTKVHKNLSDLKVLKGMLGK